MQLPYNSLAELLLEGYEVTIVEHTMNPLKINEYDPDTNEIHLNGFQDWSIVQTVKELGNRPGDPVHLLYHELGHVVAHFEGVAEDIEANEIFGDFDGQYYGTSALLKSAMSAPKKEAGFISEYAKTDPEEDFCECFAYLITKGNKIPGYLKKDKVLMKKLKYVQSLIKECVEYFEEEDQIEVETGTSPKYEIVS